MDMKAQVNKNAAASQQAASTPSGCKSCERKGLRYTRYVWLQSRLLW